MTARQWMIVGGLLLCMCQMALALETLASVYGGEPTLPSNIRIGDWGAIPRTEEQNPFEPQAVMTGAGHYGLRATTLGRYQGLRIDLKQPIDTTNILGQKNRYLEVQWRKVGNENILPAVGSLRFTFYTDRGVAFLATQEDKFYPKDTVGIWTRIGIPLANLTPELPAGARIHRIVVTTDVPADFYLGRLSFVNDNTPITINPSVIPSPVVVGKRINFRSGAFSGLTPHETRWDFDQAGGESIDAVGDSVTYTFQYLATYKVTVTVIDTSGWKEPQKMTITVKVNRK